MRNPALPNLGIGPVVLFSDRKAGKPVAMACEVQFASPKRDSLGRRRTRHPATSAPTGWVLVGTWSNATFQRGIRIKGAHYLPANLKKIQAWINKK